MKKTFALLLFVVAAPCPSTAATMNLTLNPLVAEMRVAPGSTSQTSTTVTNTGDTEERITIEPLDWSTREDGSIALQKAGTQGAHSLTSWIEPSSYGFVLHPRESRRIDVALQVPQQSRAASTWGGFLIRASTLDGVTAIGPGATFFIYNDSAAVHRHVSIASLRVITVGKNASVHVRIHNDGDAYARAAGILTVLKNGKVIERRNVSIGAIFPGKLRSLQLPVTLATAGSYTIQLHVDYNGDTIAGAQTTLTAR